MRHFTALCVIVVILGLPQRSSGRYATPALSPEELREQVVAVVVGRLVGTTMADDRHVGTWATLDIQEVVSGPMPTGTVRILIYRTLEPHVAIPLPPEDQLPEGRRLSRRGEPDQWLKRLHPKAGETLDPREVLFYEWGACIDAHIKELHRPQVWLLTRSDPTAATEGKPMPALGISLAQHVRPLSEKGYLTEVFAQAD